MPSHEPNRALNRHQLETIAWQVTPLDYRGGSGSRRSVLMNSAEGTTLVPLSDLTDNQLRKYIGPEALEAGGDMNKNGRGIYHGTAAGKDDYVIHQHVLSKRYYADRVGSGGTHTTIGSTRGFHSVEAAIQGIRDDAHVHGISDGAIFEQRRDEDDLVPIAEIRGHRRPAPEPTHRRNGPSDLSFDLREYGAAMNTWNAGQGDPIYAVGSYASSGKIHPDRDVIEGALEKLERLNTQVTSRRDKKDLLDLSKKTKEILELRDGTGSNSRRPRSARADRSKSGMPDEGGLHQDEQLLKQFVEMTAESMEIENWQDAEVTTEVIEVARRYDEALWHTLTKVAFDFPPGNRGTAHDLWDANAPYLVLMTLRGEGVGIWDGDWDDFYANTDAIEEIFKRYLRAFADGSGSGSLDAAFMNAAEETTGQTPNARRAGATADEHAARELSLYIENEYSLVGATNSQGKAIEKALLSKIRNGTFDFAKSEIAWMHLIESGAKKYAKEFADASDWSKMFTKPTRELVAHEFATSFAEEHGAGAEDVDLDEPTIERITKAYIRTYSESGQVTAYVEWIDSTGQSSRTEGDPKNAHMEALLARAKREGVSVKKEVW